MRFSGRRGSNFGNRRFGGGGPSRFDRERRQDAPLKVGEEYDVEIKEVGSKGDGIARVNNFVVFVNGSKMGEKTRIKITEVMNRFAIGEKVGGKASEEVQEEESEEEAEKESEGSEEESSKGSEEEAEKESEEDTEDE